MICDMNARRFVALAGYAAMGPITGPLVAGVVRNLAKRQPVLAGLYALALPIALLNLALLSAWAAQAVAH